MFASVIDTFAGFRPLLAAIKGEYDANISTLNTLQLRIDALEVGQNFTVVMM